MLQGEKITRRDVIECFPVWGWLVFEKTLFDKLRHGLGNLRRPFSDVSVEHPPVKDAIDGVLCIGTSGQIVENFWRWRWKSWVGEHTF